jgi:glycogen(starch) synthase
MLVHNGVEGDSRVQKQARSAAKAGWDVTLVGIRTRASTRVTWQIGDAEVRLVRLPAALLAQKVQQRRSLRRPLAYPPGSTGSTRRRYVAAKRDDILFGLGRLAEARRAGAPTWQLVVGHLALMPIRATLKVVRPWVRFRQAELDRLLAARSNGNSLLTRLSIRTRKIVSGKSSWRHFDPALLDLELAFAPVVDRLRPDIIHANDFRMIGVGARAKMRAALRGRSVKLVWDAHELVSGVVPPASNPRWLPGQEMHEREYAPYADAVVTVSPPLADMLAERYRLRERPAVVMNAPEMLVDPGDVPDLRQRCGLNAATPVLAYCGAVARQRGLQTVVEALKKLPDVHLVLLSLQPNGGRADAEALRAHAAEMGVADRMHLLPYLPHHQVVPFLAGADAAVSPLLHTPNHEVALTNKFFEYAQARLPQVVSDVRLSDHMIRTTGVGEVFRAGDVDDLVRAVRTVLADPARYRAGYDRSGLLEEWTWEHQSAILDEVYRRVLS